MKDCILGSLVSSEIHANGTQSAFVFKFCDDEILFKGHFPEHPLLPGVFQIEMSRTAAEIITGVRLHIDMIKKAKFMRPIYPNEQVLVQLNMVQYATDHYEINANISVGDDIAGRLLLNVSIVGIKS